MIFEWALEPISDEDPCGPDLFEDMDEAYEAVMFYGPITIPEPYVDIRKSPPETFDPAKIDVAPERAKIEAVLQRSRDIRPLMMLAQWEALAANFVAVADIAELIAAMIETFGSDLHPNTRSDAGLRRGAVDQFSEVNSMIAPLQYLGLTGNREVTLRKLRLAAGNGTAYDGEAVATSDELFSTLSDDAFAKPVTETHDSMLRLGAALAKIQSKSKIDDSSPHNPDFGRLPDTVTELREALESARPELAGLAEAMAQEAGDDEDEAAEADTGTESAAPSAATTISAPPISSGAAHSIASHNEARGALEACEAYFKAHEPSSAALFLVTQARQLIGKSLIEAFEILMPQRVNTAQISLGPGGGITIPVDRLRALHAQATTTEGNEGEAAPEPPTVESLADVASVALGVENYFRTAERSSPVPMVLARARATLDKDFDALMRDILVEPPQSAPEGQQ